MRHFAASRPARWRHDLRSGDPDGEGAEGAGTTQPPATPKAAAGSAEAAFKTWMDQFNAKDWAEQYDTLVSAQQAVISKGQYVTCRSQVTAPKFKWGKLLAVTDAGATTIPGTKAKLPSTKVRVQVFRRGHQDARRRAHVPGRRAVALVDDPGEPQQLHLAARR